MSRSFLPAFVLVLAVSTVPLSVHAQSLTQCLLAHNQGLITPACAHLLGLSVPPSQPQTPPDNGGVHLKQTVTYQPLDNVFGQDSILGLRLGMTQADATSTMTSFCGKAPQVTNTYLSTTYKGVGVNTQYFPSTLTCQKGQDSLTVRLSIPVMGAVVTKIERSASFPMEASPHYVDLQADIASKYGLHLQPMTRYGTPSGTAYAGPDGKVVTTQTGTTAEANEPLTYTTPHEMAYLSVTVIPVGENLSNVSGLRLTLEDLRAEEVMYAELFKQMNGSVDAKLSGSTVKAAL